MNSAEQGTGDIVERDSLADLDLIPRPRFVGNGKPYPAIFMTSTGLTQRMIEAPLFSKGTSDG